MSLNFEADTRMPDFQLPPKRESEKGEDELYPFSKLGFNVRDIKSRYNDVMAPLTLFAPYPHEDEKRRMAEELEAKLDEEPISKEMELERPVTPINDQIKIPPTTFKKLVKLVRRRVSAKEDEHLGKEQQQELAAILMGELNAVWSDLKGQDNDPFLSPSENKEMLRRITVHIVTVCEQLFLHYLQKAKILSKRGVFSGPANMSRLKVQLALDTHKFLDILTIRRYIVSDLREKYNSDEETEEQKVTRKADIPEQLSYPKLSYKGLMDISRPKSRQRKKKQNDLSQEVMELQNNMPGLDTFKLQALVKNIPYGRPTTNLSDTNWEKNYGFLFAQDMQYYDDLLRKNKPARKKTSEDISREKCVFKRSDSVPLLNAGDTLLEELGIDEDGRNSAASLGDAEEAIKTERSQKMAKAVPVAQPGTREYAAEDLKRLVGRGAEDDDKEDEDDLPPLLQALTRAAKHDGKKEMLAKQMKQLAEEEKIREEAERITIRDPTHPQPATVSAKLPNKMVVRTSDIRVSERVCLSSITLDKHATVYNDILDDIDPITVKKLDSNLFLGDEITEVYHEIMKTVPTDHLNLENDPMIEPAADTVNLSGALASATLGKKRSDRIINPSLHRDIEPPWGVMALNDWARTPGSPPKDMRGRDIIDAMTPKGVGNDLNNYFGQEAAPAGEDHAAGGMHEIMARSYASWLSWWKNTINSDDYMKYLSTQESDYMGVIFHFYNSDVEGSDSEDDVYGKAPSRSSKKSKVHQEEREKKLKDLRVKKNEFKEGFWNPNSIFMGGLGQDPSIDDDEHDSLKTPTTDTKSIHTKTPRSQSMVISRKSQKSMPEGSSTTYMSPDKAHLGVDSTQPASRQTRLTPGPANLDAVSEKSRDEPKELTPQDRLERVWNTLKMPDNQRLDMAIKYSSDDYHDKLDAVIEAWERATEMIMQRETLIARLENFERLASDPNRFFEKGYRGSSVARLDEARIRSTLYKQIDNIEIDIKRELEFIKRQFMDVITFQGRPYPDKMQWDRTEMLYWLQEERKQQALDYESRMKNLPFLATNLARLDPITPQVSVQ